jgi:hypothetical protein
MVAFNVKNTWNCVKLIKKLCNCSAPNHLLSWTTVYAANSFGIYRLTPLQAHVLPLFVRPLVAYSDKIINKEKMPHLMLSIGEGGSGKTWSYLLGCIDYIVRGSHFQSVGQVQHVSHQYPSYPMMSGTMPTSLRGQHQLLLQGGVPLPYNQGMASNSSNYMLGNGNGPPKAIILLPTKEAVTKMKKLLGDLADAITESWMKSQVYFYFLVAAMSSIF